MSTTVLGLDFGSSSLKAAVLQGTRAVTRVVRAGYRTQYDGVRAEVDAAEVLAAMKRAIAEIPKEKLRRVECLAMSVMSPAWVAMDRRGRAITPIVTHQDRRSMEVAREIEKRVGRARHLRISGNRPVPGGISSTTCGWFVRNAPGVMRRADLVGHLNTFLIRQLSGARVIDPANASFTGLYETVKQDGWSDELISAAGISREVLPEIVEADRVVGKVGANEFGLPEGLPVVAGIVDTSSAMLLIGAEKGKLLNVAGTTDVLSVCSDRAQPGEDHLTRALGVGCKWMSVCTIPAAGSAVEWARRTLFTDYSGTEWTRALREIADLKLQISDLPVFDPSLAGSRTSVEQPRAAFANLTLSTTREEMLRAVIEALAHESAARIPILQKIVGRLDRRVTVTGGVLHALPRMMYRDWPGRWTFHREEEATLRGLGMLIPRAGFGS
jgi:xylulokinase